MGMGNAFAALTEGWFGGVNQRHAWEDRADKKKRQEKLDTYLDEEFGWQREENERTKTRFGWETAREADADRARDLIYSDNQAMRSAYQNATAATYAEVARLESLGVRPDAVSVPVPMESPVSVSGPQAGGIGLPPEGRATAPSGLLLPPLDPSGRAYAIQPDEAPGALGVPIAVAKVAPTTAPPTTVSTNADRAGAAMNPPAQLAAGADAAQSGNGGGLGIGAHVAIASEREANAILDVLGSRYGKAKQNAADVSSTSITAQSDPSTSAKATAALASVPGSPDPVQAAAEGIGVSPETKHPAERRKQAAVSWWDQWAKVGMPEIVKARMAIGDFDGAQRMQEWADTRTARTGGRIFAQSYYALAVNDDRGFLDGMKQLHDMADYYPDGFTMVREKSKVTRGENGEMTGAVLTYKDEQTGEEFTQSYDSMDDVIAAGMMLSPENAFEFAQTRSKTAEFRQATAEEAAAYGATGGQFGPDGRFYPVNPPSGFAVETGPDGQVRVVQGAGAQGSAGKPFTEAQSKDNIYATRAEGALATLDPIAGALPDRGAILADKVPLGIARGAQSDQYQVARVAADEFLQAILRKDTGAAITAQEQDLYGKTYLPQPGDGEAAMAQKAQARRRAVEALKAGMSPAQIIAQEKALQASGSDRLSAISQPGDEPPGSEPPAQQPGQLVLGHTEDGYRYKGGDPADPNSWEQVQ